jgi:hypothetical protein
MATVVQVNACQDCAGVEQQNLAFIFQDISTNNVFMYAPDLMASNPEFMKKTVNEGADIAERLMNLNKSQTFLMWIFSVSEDGELQALSLENMATVVQVNACQDCAGVEQQNLAFIFQDISTNNVSMYVPDLMASNPEFMKKTANVASIIQENICIECARVNQQNLVAIFQEIDVDNFWLNSDVYQKYLDISQNDVSNITGVSQINQCVICQNVDQTNLVFILQNIGPEDLFIPASGFIAQHSLFIDLANIAMIISRSTSESDVHDVEWTYRKFKRYFVPVRPGGHSPQQSTGTREQTLGITDPDIVISTWPQYAARVPCTGRYAEYCDAPGSVEWHTYRCSCWPSKSHRRAAAYADGKPRQK